MADTVLQSEGFPYTGDFNSAKWPRGLTPSGASARVRTDGDANGRANSYYGRLTTAPVGNRSAAGVITRRFAFPDNQGRNVEIRGEFKWPSTREVEGRFYLRSGSPSLSAGTSNGFYLGIIPTTGLIVIGGGTGTRPERTLGRLTPGRWYSFRFRASGTLLRAKVWPKGTPEPDWLLATTQTVHAGSGNVAGGVYVVPGLAAQATYFDIDEVVVTTASETLPAAPTVSAGTNATAPIGALFARTASAKGTGTLRYAWSMVSRPSGSSAALTGGTPTVRLTPDVAGNYTISLTVTDPLGQQGTSQFTLTAAPRSALGGRLVADEDLNWVAGRHRVWTGTTWSK